MCNYCKKLGHIKADCQALKVKNKKAQTVVKHSNRSEEVHFLLSTSSIERNTTKDTHILTMESTIEVEVLLTTEESTRWLLDSDTSYNVTMFRSQFRSYTARNFESVRVANSQYCTVIDIRSVAIEIISCQSTLTDVCKIRISDTCDATLNHVM